MKRTILRLSLLILPALGLIGCGTIEKSEVENVIMQDLDQLKDLDENTIYEYLSAEDLFPDLADESSEQELTSDFITDFFADFDYKILKIKIKDDTATASVELYTPDAAALAQDFKKASLNRQIYSAAETGENNQAAQMTVNENLSLLTQLLQENDYSTIESDCNIELYKTDGSWYINKTSDLENEIVGGFISSISDPDLLTPEQTLSVYLDALQKMDEQQLSNYLGIASFMDTEDEQTEQIANALIGQVISCFEYEITGSEENDYTADVGVAITTFDAQAIENNYEEQLNDYLSTPQALYDGSDGRLQYSYALMLSCIQDNTDTTVLAVNVAMTNDGVGWQMNRSDVIGNALFGTLTDTLNSYEDSFDSGSDNDSSYDSDSDESSYYDSDSGEAAS